MRATLAEIVANKKIEVERRKKLTSIESLRRQISLADDCFKRAIATPQVHFICEVKPRSPSEGVLRSELQLDQVIGVYNEQASAISVLTDEKYFGGSLSLLSKVKEMSLLPLLCKDFIIDPYQCFEARLFGADAILLIAKILKEHQLSDLYHQITDLGMVPVVEIQNIDEIEKTQALNADVFLINNRNLNTFEVNLETTRKLVPMLSERSTKIAASGIECHANIGYLQDSCSNFLIGSALMKARDIDAKLRELKGEAHKSNSVQSALKTES